uniref:Small subunit processome component 20 n=2 Tax=Lygus hesperus TaxID=30085 RepID=A0A146LBX0_LYGHE
MKNKPLRHKEFNTFKFEPFSQRIASIKIDVFHKIKHKYDEDDEETTFFYQALEKWTLLNLSDPFEELRQDLGSDLKILPQLVKQKDHIVSVLQKHLGKKDHLSLQCVLELIVALAKDLRQDFHPHFLTIYRQMIPLVESRNPELMEWTFHALAYLFKFLWRYLVTNLAEVFDSLLPLLSSSKPTYINSFAAQSFAFVARKVRDPARLVKLTVRSLKKSSLHGADGCGRLVFEIVKGVPGQFHSCAEDVLSTFLDSLLDQSIHQGLLNSVIKSCFSYLFNEIHVNHVSLAWKVLLDKLEKFCTKWNENVEDKFCCDAITRILELLLQSAEHKRGYMIVDPESLVRPLLLLLLPEKGTKEWKSNIIKILAAVLLSPTLKLTQELSSTIVKTCMTRLVEGELLDFVWKTKSYSAFEGLILPQLLSFCLTKPPLEMLNLLSSLVLEKAPLPLDIESLLTWAPYNLDFSFAENTDATAFCSSYVEVLERFDSQNHSSAAAYYEECANALIVLPNMLPLDKDRVQNATINLLDSVCKRLVNDSETQDQSEIDRLLLVLPLAVDGLIKLNPEGGISKAIPPERIVDTLLRYSSAERLAVLRALNFYICCDELKSIETCIPEIQKHVYPLIGSPYHKVRLLALQISWQIEKLSSGPESMRSELLELSYQAERTPLTITDYREKIKILQKLSCTNPSVSQAVADGSIDGKLLLRYLLGSLYLNFKLIWEPLRSLVVTYSRAMALSDFWEVFHAYLNEVVKNINDPCEDSHNSLIYDAEHLKEAFSLLNDLDERPDHINVRILLWKTLEECVPICETKNKDIVTIFLNFLNNEYFKKNAEAAISWDITKKTDEDVNLTIEPLESSVAGNTSKMDVSVDDSVMDVVDDSTSGVKDETLETLNETDNKDEDYEIKEELKEVEPDFDKKYRWVTKSLLSHMAVFGKLRSPKSMHKEQELFKIYLDFLSHKLPDVQKAALDCIMTYKFKYLTPYKENLYGLIDEKTFKNEVSLFRIDTESDVVKADHRPDLIPLVLRVVYSKMYTKSSATKGSNKQARKATVIRFLGGCSKLELESFFKMAFSLFHDWVSKEDLLSVLDEITLNVDLKAVIPPRRLQSAVYLLNTVLVYCGGLLGPSQLGYLLRVSLVIMAHITGILQNRDEVFPGYIRAIRGIRNTCFEVLARFYKTFDSYPWTLVETEGVFKVYVWPYLSKLPVEGIHSPTAQLRLFMVWSQNPRYFVLLGKTHDEDKRLSPIEAIMDLWASSKTHASVCNAVMDMVQSLMTVQDFTGASNEGLIGDEEVKPLEISHQALFEESKFEKIEDGESLNYGSKLLVRFVPIILERLKRKLESKRGLERKEREVMSRVTELVTDAESSEVVLELLLPSLVKKSESSDDVISPLLSTVYNLIKNVTQPGRYVRKLAPLYGSVASPSARKLLFSIVIALSKQEGSESGLDDQLLDDLNAWDSKWVDQPDFERRLSAFNKLESMADEGTLTMNLGVIVIYTCFHFVRSEKDMSMRDNARHCLEKVCVSLCRQVADDASEKSYLLDNIILGQIRRGFASKQADNVRNDSISLLGHMARECGNLHAVLGDLSHLANKQDMEVDFFENLRHLQLHRRVRAMLKFSTVASELDKPMVTRTLTQFILPIVSHYLLSIKYKNKNTIVDSAIKAVGTVCQYLPWHQYQAVLVYYLSKLQEGVDFQRQIVRILVDILNAFHFNLTKADLSVLMEVKGVLAEKDVGKENEKPTSHEKSTNGKLDLTADHAEEAEAEGDETKMEKELEVEDETEVESPTTKESNSEIILSPGGATKVIVMITQQILPKLHQVMAQKTTSETHHKLTRKMTGPEQDEEEILKVPLAVAAVKLLQKLPSKQFLDVNLPGIFMKLCTFLKSRLESVRKITRETLQTILVSLGPDYLPTLVREMKGLLTRGYQIHVLVYSIHSVLVPLEPHFQKGQLDKCAHSIIEICRMDLFGRASEEKEVNQIVGKLLEARATRSFDTFKILSKYVTERYLLDLLLPLKEELSRTMSHKYVNKVRLTLEQVVLGLTENSYLSPENLLLFAYGTSSESIPALMVDLKDKAVDVKKAEFEARRQPDSFILPEEPKRAKVVEGVNTAARTNSHLLVEFGLRLLYFLLKREKVKDRNYIPHLDPFVRLLKDCLSSEHIKIGTLAAKCMTWMVKIELPSMKKEIKEICDVLFSILHKFACAGLSKGDNFDLVLVTFNTVACIARDVKYHQLSTEQLRTLILYCEQDIEDTSKQATAFSLLKAIINLKVNTPELTEVVKKVAVVSIKASETSVRLQARQIVHKFLMSYNLGKHVETFLALYFAELNYEYLTGRESALEMIKTITSVFPTKQLDENAPAIYVNVSTVLVNDSEPSCRKTAADIISTLLSRLDSNGRNKLFDITVVWLEQKKKLIHRRLAAQLIGLFVSCEKEDFEKRLKELIPIVVEGFLTEGNTQKTGRFVRVPKVIEDQEGTSTADRDKDHFLFQLLQSTVKIATNCPAFLSQKEYTADLETITDHATHLLGHPHQWVRHSAVQLIGLVVTSYKPSEVAAVANDPSLEKSGFLMSDTKSRLKSLAHDVVAQLIPSEDINDKFLMQCMKLLTYLTEIIKDIQATEDSKLSLLWLVRMVQKMINYEVVHSPSSTVVRTMAFNYAAAVSLKLSKEELSGIAFHLLKPIARQLNVDEDGDLKKAAREASVYIKKKMGADTYNEAMAKLSHLMDVRRAERKKQRSQLMVTDPERAAKRKIDKNLKKKETMKKKIKMMKMQTYKRKKRKDPLLDD